MHVNLTFIDFKITYSNMGSQEALSSISGAWALSAPPTISWDSETPLMIGLKEFVKVSYMILKRSNWMKSTYFCQKEYWMANQLGKELPIQSLNGMNSNLNGKYVICLKIIATSVCLLKLTIQLENISGTLILMWFV